MKRGPVKPSSKNLFNPVVWQNLGHAYIDAVIILLDEIERIISKDPSKNGQDKKIRLFFPVIYNLKHAIELYVKSFEVMVFGEYTTDHCPSEILQKVLEYIQSNCNPKSKINLMNLQKLRKLQKIVIDFRDNIIGGVKIFNKPDHKNMFFRYIIDFDIEFEKNREILKIDEGRLRKELIEIKRSILVINTLLSIHNCSNRHSRI